MLTYSRWDDHTFGVCIASYPGDLRFALGTIESVRFFLGDVPICIVWDGPGDLLALRRAYGLQVLHRGNTRVPWLREHSFGFGWTKMVAFWEAPFQRFLYSDADAILWGDVVSCATHEHGNSWDVIFDKPGSPNTPDDMDRWFLHLEPASRLIPGFDWRAHLPDFANTGVFLVRTGSLDLSWYRTVKQLAVDHPELFFAGEQGALNYMAWSEADVGALAVRSMRMMTMALDHPIDELATRFPIGPNGPLPSDEPAGFLHWPLKKPWSVATDVYTAPMTHFREQAFARMRPSLAPWRAQIIRLSDRWALLRPRLRWSRMPAAANRRFRRLLGLPAREEQGR